VTEAGGGPATRIATGNPKTVHAQIAAALSSAGHDCTAQDDRVACKGDAQRGPAFFVGYREYPARMLFGSPWLLKGDCASALGAINEFNWTYDELHATCNDEGAMVITTVYFIPEGGVTVRDITGFARWWTLSEVRALSSSKLGPLLR
jgi:hypothetical protein